MKMTTLLDIPLGTTYRVAGFCSVNDSEAQKEIERCKEMGIVPGALICKKHEAPLGKDPIATQVRGCLVALRRSVARYVQVELNPEGSSHD